jgi:hypothetical protein
MIDPDDIFSARRYVAACELSDTEPSEELAKLAAMPLSDPRVDAVKLAENNADAVILLMRQMMHYAAAAKRQLNNAVKFAAEMKNADAVAVRKVHAVQEILFLADHFADAVADVAHDRIADADEDADA